jgi:hypothetical protein
MALVRLVDHQSRERSKTQPSRPLLPCPEPGRWERERRTPMAKPLKELLEEWQHGDGSACNENCSLGYCEMARRLRKLDEYTNRCLKYGGTLSIHEVGRILDGLES